MTLTEHLAELRTRLVRAMAALLVGVTISIFLFTPAYDFLLAPLCEVAAEGPRVEVVNDAPDADDAGNCELYTTDPLAPFSLRMKFAGYGGFALALPVILWQLWRFVSPGLHKNERRYAVLFVGASMALFALGAGLAYYTLPKALEFLENVGGDIVPLYEPARYFGLVLYMMLAFGVGFLFPVVLVFLQIVGVLSGARLRAWRRYAVVVIVVVVAVLTPSGDPISLAALSVPMYIFYELSILVGWLFRRKQAKAEKAAKAAKAAAGPGT